MTNVELTNYPGVEPLVEVTRGSLVESIHYGALAVVDARGDLVAHAGDPRLKTYLRSSAKPFQLLPLVESGGAEHFGFSDRELAVMAASHAGEPRHVEAVQGILARIGLTEDALQCGAHWPSGAEAALGLYGSGRRPTPIHNNCSGKHAGMLAQAVYHRLSLADYLDPRHPVQLAIASTLAGLSDLDPGDIDMGIDGCSAPCFALPLQKCALAFARLADPSALPEPRRSAIRRIVSAMTAYPEMVAGEGALEPDLMRAKRDGFDTALMHAAKGRVLSKGGAEGYQGLAVLPTGLGIAIKLMDGSGSRGGPPVALEVLRQLGALDQAALDELREYGAAILTNRRRLEVGQIRAVVKLFDVTHVL